MSAVEVAGFNTVNDASAFETMSSEDLCNFLTDGLVSQTMKHSNTFEQNVRAGQEFDYVSDALTKLTDSNVECTSAQKDLRAAFVIRAAEVLGLEVRGEIK